jgi:RNA polymerase sigma-70 factor (ECF subfamily)
VTGQGSERLVTREEALATLVQQTASGDADALALLYDQTSSTVYGLAIRILSDTADAEEITVDVFRHVWQVAGSWTASRGTVLAWLIMLTRSRCLDRLRSHESRRRAEESVRAQPVF